MQKRQEGTGPWTQLSLRKPRGGGVAWRIIGHRNLWWDMGPVYETQGSYPTEAEALAALAAFPESARLPVSK